MTANPFIGLDTAALDEARDDLDGFEDAVEEAIDALAAKPRASCEATRQARDTLDTMLRACRQYVREHKALRAEAAVDARIGGSEEDAA